MDNTERRHRVLSDHKQVGKKFIPPWLTDLGPFRETPWVNVTMVELFWIACLHDESGLIQGASLAAALSKAAMDQRPPRNLPCYAAASSFTNLSSTETTAVCELLKAQGQLEAIQKSLADLQYFYPHSPLSFLFDESSMEVSDESGALKKLKDRLSLLYDKTTRQAILMQGTAVYIAFLCGKFKVQSNSALADLPDLEQYPETEKSKIIAAAVRSITPMLIRPREEDFESEWSLYFWNRGFDLEPCTDAI